MINTNQNCSFGYIQSFIVDGYSILVVYENKLKKPKTIEELKDYIGDAFHKGVSYCRFFKNKRSKDYLEIKSKDWDKSISEKSFTKISNQTKIDKLKQTKRFYENSIMSAQEKIVKIDTEINHLSILLNEF